MKVQTDSFILNIDARTIAPAGYYVWTGSKPVPVRRGSFKLYARQNPVPSGLFSTYTANDLIPIPPYGVGYPYLVISSSGAQPEMIADLQVSITPSGIEFYVGISNPYASNVNITPTTIQFFYSIYAPTFEP